MLSLSAATGGFAQTVVPSVIGVNSVWSVADSPYLVNGNTVLQGGAVLTVEPGVTVYMGANAGLSLQSGSIRALGTPVKPIRVLSDKARLGQAASPGDWGQWVFNAGTVNTQLDHVAFEHGSGLVVNGAAPVFNNLSIRSHQGAAITLDLAASPTGVGNQASGNTVNGVVVPSGDIVGSVKWGLRGIPYVLQSGTVSVGVSPTLTSVQPTELQAGDTATFTLGGTRLTGLSDVVFDREGLTAQVLPGATDSQVGLSIVAAANVAAGPVKLSAYTDAGEVRLASAFNLAESRPLIKTLSPSTLYTGQGSVTVTVNGLALRSDTQVTVNGAVVGTAFVSATQLRATVAVPGAPATLRVALRSPDVSNPGQFLNSAEVDLPVLAAVLAVSPSPTTVFNGSSTNLNVQLPYAAPAGGIAVSLVSSVPSVATVPASVLIAEGQTTGSFALNTTGLGSSVITASRVGFSSGQATVNVVSPPKLTLTPANLTLGVGRTSGLTVHASTAAPVGGLQVSLSSSDASVANVPASVTIPAGATSTTANVSTVALGQSSITASASSYVSAQATVNVRPVSLNLPVGALVAPGLTRSIPLTLSDPAPAGGLVVSLTSSNASVASVPASLTVPEGQISANFVLTGVAAGSASVSASAAGYEAASVPVTVELVTVGIGSPAITTVSIPQGLSRTYPVTLSRPAPAGGVTVSLATADPSVATVSPATVSIAQGETSGGVVQIELTGVAKGSTSLTASAAGLSGASVPVTISDPVELKFNRTTDVVGKGMRSYQFTVQRVVNGTAFNGVDALTVNLSSSDAGKASVPVSVTIPANSSSTTFQVVGVDLTAGTPVTIDASATGYSAPATKIQVQVATPVMSLESIDLSRSVGETRSPFYVAVTGPTGGYSPSSQTMASSLSVGVAVVDATPAGLVDAIYSAPTGGVVVTELVIPAGASNSTVGSGWSYIGTPTAAGTYKVSASAAGLSPVVSGTVIVNAPELKFTRTTDVVGKGMRSYQFTVQRVVNGTAFNGVDALTVNLACSAASICSVPATVTILAGISGASFNVTGVGLGDTTVSASAIGYGSAPDLAIRVDEPQIVFSGPSNTTVNAQSNYSVWLSVPGSAYANNQTAAAPIELTFTSSAPGVATVPSTATIATGSNGTSTLKLTGVAPGTTSVTASGPGLQSATSAVVTVSP